MCVFLMCVTIAFQMERFKIVCIFQLLCSQNVHIFYVCAVQTMPFALLTVNVQWRNNK